MSAPDSIEVSRKALLAMSQVLSIAKRGLRVALPELPQEDFDAIVTLSGALRTTEWCLTSEGPRCHDAAEWTVDDVRFTARGPLRVGTVRDWTKLREQPRSE